MEVLRIAEGVMDNSGALVVYGEKVLLTCLSFAIMGTWGRCRHRERYRDRSGGL